MSSALLNPESLPCGSLRFARQGSSARSCLRDFRPSHCSPVLTVSLQLGLCELSKLRGIENICRLFARSASRGHGAIDRWGSLQSTSQNPILLDLSAPELSKQQHWRRAPYSKACNRDFTSLQVVFQKCCNDLGKAVAVRFVSANNSNDALGSRINPVLVFLADGWLFL